MFQQSAHMNNVCRANIIVTLHVTTRDANESGETRDSNFFFILGSEFWEYRAVNNNACRSTLVVIDCISADVA